MVDSYDRQTWVNGQTGGTPLNQNRLNHVEEGLDNVAAVVDDVAERVAALEAGAGIGGRYVGTTSDRALVAPGAGVEFFDTTLGYPVWGNGAGWVEADGTAVTGAGASNAPLNLAVALQTNLTAVVTWTAPAAIDGDDTYTLYWNSPAGSAQVLASGITSTTYTTAALTPGAVYAIWGNAIVDTVQSAPSNTVQFTVPGATVTATPAEALKINGLNGGTGGHWNLGIGYRPSDPEGAVHKDTTWAQLRDGWSDSRYLKLNTAGDGVVLRCYADAGRTSPKTNYGRDEFRELQSDGVTKAKWGGTSGTHTLAGKTKVTHFMAVKPEVVIGQIHDADDDRVLITVEAGSDDHVVIDVNGTELTSEPVLTGYSTGDEIDWRIVYTSGSGGTLRIYIDDVLEMTKTNVALPSTGCYFKVGAYGQANNRDQANTAGDYFEVELRDLVCSHT